MKYKLKEIFDLQMGKTPARNNDKYWNTKDYKWISIADLTSTDKYINNTKEYISRSAVKESGIKIIPANTVVMSFKLSIGKTAILSEDMYSNEAIMAFHDKHVVELLPEYTYYLIKAKNWNGGSNRAVMGQTLNKATLSEIEVDVHTIDEQRKIVELLNLLGKIIYKRNTQLSKLEDILSARFVELFGNPAINDKEWKVCRLGDECKVINGRAYKTEELLDKGKYQVLRVGNFFTNNTWYYSDLELEKDKYCEDGDLLFAWSASFGPRIWHGKKVIYHYHIWKLTGYENCLNKNFFVELLNYNCEAMKADTHGSTMLHFTKAQMEEQQLILPPIAIQEQFATFVEQVNKSKFIVKNRIRV